MAKKTEGTALNALFPRAACVDALGELSAWTSVQSVGAAARMLEQRSQPGDEPAPILIMPFDDLLNFEEIFCWLLDWFIEGYRVPSAKVSLARSLDPFILDGTATLLERLRFQPTIRSFAPGVIAGVPKNQRAFVIQDDVATIEVVQDPLRCLMDMLKVAYDATSASYVIRRESKETTGGVPTIFHRAIWDSRLFSVVEALSFAAMGMEIGPYWGTPAKVEFVFDYRAVNVQTTPPIGAHVLDGAKVAMKEMLDGLR